MTTINKFISLYIKLMIQQLKCMMAYKMDFLIMLAFTFFTQISGLFFIYLIFSKIPYIDGWNMWEVIFMYGMIYFTEGVINFLFEGTWLLGQYIHSGNLDRYILRPLPIGMQVLATKINLDGFGKILISACMMAKALSMLEVNWNLAKVGMFILFILSASIIRVCLNLSANCTCFWLKGGNTSFAHLIHTFSEFGKYPLTIFQTGIQFVLIFIIPYAFISFFPTLYILDRGEYAVMGLLTPVVALITICITFVIFKLGLRVYDSPGN